MGGQVGVFPSNAWFEGKGVIESRCVAGPGLPWWGVALGIKK